MPNEALFSIHNLALNHESATGNHATVLDIDALEIYQGEKVALLGVSGAGKSTLLDYLYRQQSEHIAYCPQQLGLVSILSVFHNIYIGQLHEHSNAYNLLNLIWPQAEPKTRISAWAERVGLTEKLMTSVGQLSGGQQQRTGLARALNRQADIFLGDEPVSAIDQHQAGELVQLINQHHATVIVAVHDKALALAHFDRIIGIRNGRIMLDQKTSDITSAQLDELYRV